MADLTIREKFFDDLAKGARWDVGVSIARGNPLPLDANSVFESYADLEAYAAGVLAYPGQIVAVVNADSTGVYYLDQEKAIKPVGVIPAGDNLSIDMDENDVVSLHNFGKVFYKYVAENGDVAAHYEKVEVSNDNPWVAGLEPRVVTEDGKLVIGWYEPNPTTIEGVNDQVTAVQGTVEDLVESVGTPSTENSEATGLYKEVEDVQEDVEELIDAVGSSDDALDENVQTIWAHVNNHTERIEALEAIDHDAYATKVALAEEVTNRENAIEGLQNQINLIMDNPDTENVIDSISEFMTYISEHGEIAEGFRTDIDKNKEDIGKEIEAARAAEGALSDRLDVLEAIDHDAYIAADTALKEELIADAASKYATTGALEEAVNDLDARLDALEEVDNATQEELDAVEGKADSNTAAIQNLSGRLDGIVAQGGEPNVINNIKVNGVVQAIAEDKSVDIAVPTKFSDITDDSGFDARITAAKEQADKGVSDAAAADAKAVKNAEDISKHDTRIETLETAKGDHESRIIKLENADITHAAEYAALKGIVDGHTTTIAQKADSTALAEVSNKASANETAIKALNETTIPAVNSEIAKKADASALENYHTKAEIAAITGTVEEGKTLVQMIADAKVAATYDDTEVRGLISTEAARADAAEKANAAEIARVNAVLVAAIENEDDTALNSIKELADWINTHGTEASDMADAISANTDAIAAINHAETGILVTAQKYADDQIAAIPVATAEALGLVKIDNDTVKMNEANQLYVAKVSTDILTQGEQVLILNGGSANA